MHDEIGSEFWTGCTPTSEGEFGMRPKVIYDCHRYEVTETLSGRTALEYIVEILCGVGMKSAYLPSYCCHTMIEPFLRHGVTVRFYDVQATLGGLHRAIDNNVEYDAILLMDYFGHTDEETFGLAVPAKEKGKAVIYDATHSMYSSIDTIPYDFIYGSYRKWVDINCGFAAWDKTLHKGEIVQNFADGAYASIRKELFDKKAMFINGEIMDKEVFLSLIDEAEMTLDCDYHHKLPDDRSKEVLRTTDVDYIIAKRCQNASVLTEAVNGLNDERVCCINPLLNTHDTPLFVPVIVSPEHRDPLRRYLIAHEIYCPVHWPIPDIHERMTGSAQLFSSELSLICDHRYGREDMLRIAATIADYLKKN